MTKRRAERPSQTSQHNEWLERLDRISGVVDAWSERSKSPVSPAPGSSLAADSLGGLSVSKPVWYSMCVSAEHLEFAIDAMRATSTMYPTAYMTVARTAFVAAVNAVWILAATPRQERRERALRFRADDLRAQITSIRDMRIPKGKPHEARSGLLRQLYEQQADLQRVGTELGVQEDVAKMRFHQTQAIDWVAEHMHGIDDELLIGATQEIWRSGSAAAHAQFHFGVMRFDRSDVKLEASGDSIVRLRGDLENDVGPAIAAATLALGEAFRIYDLRRVPHLRN